MDSRRAGVDANGNVEAVGVCDVCERTSRVISRMSAMICGLKETELWTWKRKSKKTK